MKSKILNFLLIITSLLDYLEWSGNSSSFLFQANGEIFSKFFADPISVLHPKMTKSLGQESRTANPGFVSGGLSVSCLLRRSPFRIIR